MATRDHRLAELSNGPPPPGQPLQLLCEDHCGTYLLPFRCEWRDEAWYGADKTRPIAATVVGSAGCTVLSGIAVVRRHRQLTADAQTVGAKSLNPRTIWQVGRSRLNSTKNDIDGGGPTMMNPADQYRVKAGDMASLARAEKDPFQKAEFERLSLAYLRLADQADRNSRNDVCWYDPVADKSPAQSQAQQQQQPQPKAIPDK